MCWNIGTTHHCLKPLCRDRDSSYIVLTPVLMETWITILTMAFMMKCTSSDLEDQTQRMAISIPLISVLMSIEPNSIHPRILIHFSQMALVTTISEFSTSQRQKTLYLSLMIRNLSHPMDFISATMARRPKRCFLVTAIITIRLANRSTLQMSWEEKES